MAKSDFQNEVVARIRQLRLDNDISQARLAEIIFVSNGQIGNIESPKFPHKYTLKHLSLIAQYFDVSVKYLITGSNVNLSNEELINILIKYDE